MEVAGAEFAAKFLAQIVAIAVDFEGRVLFWSSGAERTYGLATETVIGKSVSNCYLCEYLNGENEKSVLCAVREKGKWVGNCRHTLKDGREFFVESEIGLLRDDADAEIGLMIIVRDAIVRPRWEAGQSSEALPPHEEARICWEQLGSSSDVLERFLENLPASAYVKDESGRRVFNNRAAREAGPAVAGSAGMTGEKLFGPELGNRIPAIDLAALPSDEPVCAIQVLDTGEQQRTFQVIQFPIVDSHGRRFVGGVSLEITENVRNQEELRKQAALLDLASDAIFVTTLEGAITYWNRGAERLYGWTAADAMGKDDRDLLRAKLPLPYDQLVKQLLRDGEWEGEVTRSHRNGATIEILTRWSLLRDSSGAPIARLVTNTNLTDTKIAIRELRKAQADAEARASELNALHRRLEALMNALPVGVSFSDDATCRNITGNSAVLAQFEVTSEDNLSASAADRNAPGRQVRFFQNGRPIADVDLPLQRAVAENREISGLELEVQLPSGRSWTAECYGAPVRDANGEVIGGVAVTVDVTGRKLAERQIGEAHRQLESVLNSISDGFAVLDNEWRYTYFNHQGASILGMRPEELVGNCVWEVFPHLKGTKVDEAFHQAVESGQPVRFEAYSAGPPIKWLECQCYPSDGGLSVYFRDVTERRAAEKAIRASESRFRKLFESDLMGICIPDRFGAFLEGNDEFLRIVGYSREDLEAGRVRWDIMTPAEYRELDALHIAEAAERGSCIPYEKEYVRKDGNRVPIACGYTLLEGSKDVYIAYIQDLSARKQAEAELREREQRFRVLAESLPDFVWMRSADGRYIYCNQRLLDYVGKPPGWLSDHAFDAVHPEDRNSTAEKWQQSIEKGETYLNSYRLRRHDGIYRYFLARAVPMRDESGHIQRWIGSTTDIHDQKMAEDALRRTEKLDAAARLAASMAHEINNPLNSVVNMLYLALQDQTLNDSARGLLNLADQELARAVQVATQMLRFHKQSTAPALVDLSEIMDSVLAMFGSRLNPNSIAVDREYLAHEKVHCFNDELRQVFANLISNSLDAIKGKGRIRIRMSGIRIWDSARTPGVRVTVADTGDGIPLELQKRVFEPFVSTKENTGTGLGLWVSEGIVKKHNGRIALRSSTNPARHGTVFSLLLPLTTLDN